MCWAWRVALWTAMVGWFGVLMWAAAMLWAAPAIGAGLRRGELEILARVVQAETTGEPEAGARAVAWTVLNRMAEPETYGRTVTAVLLKPYQYAKPVPLNDNSEAYLRALLATVQALLGVGGDPGQGATHFHVCSMRPAPAWAARLRFTVKISRHCFYRRR